MTTPLSLLSLFIVAAFSIGSGLGVLIGSLITYHRLQQKVAQPHIDEKHRLIKECISLRAEVASLSDRVIAMVAVIGQRGDEPPRPEDSVPIIVGQRWTLPGCMKAATVESVPTKLSSEERHITMALPGGNGHHKITESDLRKGRLRYHP